MKRFRRGGRLLLAATLALSLLGSTGCCLFKTRPPIIVMPEAQASQIKKGTPSPLDGWVLSGSALARILEKAESCK